MYFSWKESKISTQRSLSLPPFLPLSLSLRAAEWKNNGGGAVDEF